MKVFVVLDDAPDEQIFHAIFANVKLANRYIADLSIKDCHRWQYLKYKKVIVRGTERKKNKLVL